MLVNNIAKTFQTITANFSGLTRHDQMGGRDYLVAPAVMMLEGVLNGSGGPIYYPKDEISKFPAAWNSKPVVVYHPERNGVGITACDPDIITNRGIGVMLNTKWEDDKLKTEVWFEIERANIVDNRIMEAVENKKVMELSTGLYIESDGIAGEFNGKHYDGTARNFQPDHLALLPDLKGACSVDDGAGFLRLNKENTNIVIDVTKIGDEERKYILANDDGIVARISSKMATYIQNEMSHSNIRGLLSSLLKVNNEDLWIDEVFDSFFIYEDAGKLYKQSYVISDSSVNFEGEKEEVVRVTEFRTKDGKFIGNIRKEKTMEKKKLVDGLITNAKTKWKESDREALMAMNEDVLEKLEPETKEPETKEPETKEPETKEPETKEPEVVENMSVEDFLAKKVPTGLRGVLQNALKVQNSQKKLIIDEIIANEKNTFTEEFLNTKDIEELANIANLARDASTSAPEVPRFNYGGQGGQGPLQNRKAGEPLPLPSMVG